MGEPSGVHHLGAGASAFLMALLLLSVGLKLLFHSRHLFFINQRAAADLLKIHPHPSKRFNFQSNGVSLLQVTAPCHAAVMRKEAPQAILAQRIAAALR